MSDYTPSRRGLLAVVTAAVGGGCLDRAASTPAGSNARPDWPTPDATTHSGFTSDPVATVTVGDDDRRPSNVEPHQVVVSVAGDSDGAETSDGTETASDAGTTDGTRVTTRVWRDETRAVARTDTLSPDRDLLVDFREPDEYLVAVRAARDERGVVVSNRDRTWFDCNESATTVAVTPDGYARGFITTTMACATVE